jgi:hypothetical protein
MATFKAASVLKTPITCAQAGQVVAATGVYEVPATLAANDIVALCHLPAEHEPVDFILQADDLDEATAITLTVGVLNAAMDDLVANTDFITASTVAQAGGVARADVVLGLQLAASNADRVIGVKVVTGATTEAAGTLKGVLIYKPK